MKSNRSQSGKRFISMLLVFVMIFSLLPVVQANAVEKTYEVFSANIATYKDNGDVQSVTANENWNTNLVASDNVSIQGCNGWWGTDGHWANANELSTSALYSTNAGGYAVFKVPMEEGASITKLIVNGRECMGTAVSFAVSNAVDGEFTTVYTFTSDKSGNDVEVDISSIAAGWDEVYVKAIFPETPCADWAALWNIRAAGTVEEQVEEDDGTTIQVPVSYEVFAANVATYKDNGDVQSVTANENWNTNLVASDNVSIQGCNGWWGTDGHWANANELSTSALYSTNAGGYAVFKVPMEEGASITKLIVNGRECMGTAVSFAVSNAVDGEFTTVYTFTSDKSGNDVEVVISSIAADWDEVYVKAIFPETPCADWAALWNIRAAGTVEEKVEEDVNDDNTTVIEKPVSYDVFAANNFTVNENTGDTENVTKNENWNVNLVASDNVQVANVAGWWGTDGHWNNGNNTVNGMYSVDGGSEGYAVFKVPMEEGAYITKLIVNGRECMGTAVSFAVSNAVDGEFTIVYTFTSDKSGNDVEVDISSVAAEWDEVYVKAIFPETPCSDWGALWNIRASGIVEEVVEKNTMFIDVPVSYDVFAANVFTVNANTGDAENVTKNENWNVNLVASDNVQVANVAGWHGTDGHWHSNHNTVNGMYSVDGGSEGYAVFKVPSEDGATITTLIINGRECAGSAVSVAVSNAAGGEYTTVYTATSATSGQDAEVDIAAVAADWEEVYVKAMFPTTMCIDWAALWNVRAAGTVKVEVESELVDVYSEVFMANDYTVDANDNITSTSANADWNVNLVDSSNVELKTAAGWYGTNGYEHSNHNTVSALYATNDGGYATFVVPVEDGATLTKLIFNGRFCAGTAVSFAVSNAVDGSFTRVYTVEESKSGQDVEIDVSSIVAGWETVYVKAIFPETMCADWAALWGIGAVAVKEVVKEEDTSDKYDPNPTDDNDSLVIHWPIGAEDRYDLTGENVNRATVTTTAGGISENYQVLVLGAGQSISFTVPQELGTATNLTLELREIHKHGDGDVNFTVALNGETLAESVATPVSEGPIHTWVDINKYKLTEDDTITITNNGEQDVRLESVWLYENIDSLMVEEDVYEPMEFVLFTLPISYTDYESDLALVQEYKQNYSGYNKYTVGMAFDIYYMQWETKVLFERLDWLIRLAADTDTPLYLDLNSWWSGTAWSGMDGKGGFWGDLNYQQVIYDPDNVNGQGVWQLSTPNMWGNTPWLSMNEAWYNTVRNDRLEMVSDFIAMKQAEYAAKGEEVDVNIFMENEPTYWAYKHYNPSTTTGRADLSYTVIQDALRQGFNLDPTDGLSDGELLWLLNNHTTYIEAEGNAVASGLGNNSILIVDDQVTYPTSQNSEKVYSHVQTNKHIIGGVTYPQWETHLVDSLRMGLEYASVSEMSALELEYVVARGSFADVNIERSAINNFKVINQLYKYGADHAILFNIHADDYTKVAEHDVELSEIQEDVKIRTRSLWIASRANVERLLTKIDGTVKTAEGLATLESAKQAYENGRYETAYDLLMKAQSIADLPMEFTVSGTGKLLDYPVTISSEEVVNVTLYSVGDTLKLKFTSEVSADVTVTWEGVGSYTVVDLGDGVYQFTKGGKESGAATVKSAPYYEKDYPDAFEAMFRSFKDDSISITTQDSSVGEYVTSVALKLADDCIITRAQEGNEGNRKTVTINELSAYDALELKLNENDEVVEIKATYGYLIGRVVSVQYPVVDGMVGLSNPSITIRTADGATHTFEICAITSFSYPTQTGNNMQTSNLTDYGLVAGDKIKITYSPYTSDGSSIKAIKVYKDDYNTVVINEDFEDKEFGEYDYIENVHICDLDGNYHNQVVTATDKDQLGIMIWEIQQDGGNAIRDLTVEFGARNILGTSIRFYMSDDGGQTWTQIGEGELDTWTTLQQIYIDGITANTVQIKCELDSRGTGDPDTWSSLDRITIKIPSGDLVAAQAVDELILAIGEVTKDSKEAIEAARAAYDALTDAQKEIVENDDILAEAEKAYQAILDAEKAEADKKAADAVIALIDAIGTVTTESEEAIEAARAAYDALTDDQKALVTNYETLVQAEAALDALKNPSEDTEKPGDNDEKEEDSGNADTGDHSGILLWTMLLMLSALAAICLLKKKSSVS